MFRRKKQFDTYIESINWGGIRFNKADLLSYEIGRGNSEVDVSLHFEGRSTRIVWTGETASYQHVRAYVEHCLGVG